MIVSGLGSAALGFAGVSNQFRQTDFLICLIPLVCAYVDLMYLHLTLRILVIGTFIRKFSETNNDATGTPILTIYENYAETTRDKMGYPNSSFGFEWLAIRGSSIYLSIGVIVFGFITTFSLRVQPQPDLLKLAIFALFGALGLIMTYFIFNTFHYKTNSLDMIDIPEL